MPIFIFEKYKHVVELGNTKSKPFMYQPYIERCIIWSTSIFASANQKRMLKNAMNKIYKKLGLTVEQWNKMESYLCLFLLATTVYCFQKSILYYICGKIISEVEFEFHLLTIKNIGTSILFFIMVVTYVSR